MCGRCLRQDIKFPYLPESDSRGSSVIVSALKSKGSASWRSSILSLSVLPFDLVYLDSAGCLKNKKTTFVCKICKITE